MRCRRVLTGPAVPGRTPQGEAAAPARLKDVETAMIRRAVAEARGNVMKAARMLGISRATVYRRLGIWQNAGLIAAFAGRATSQCLCAP